MKYFVFGDIHGCYQEFGQLLQIIPDKCHVVSLGDLVDKGPDSVKVLRMWDDLDMEKTYIRGNHDDKVARYLKAKDREREGEKYKGPQKVEGWVSDVDESDDRSFVVSMLDTSKYFMSVHDVEYTDVVTFVHGGIPGQMRGYLEDKKKKALKSLLFCRYLAGEDDSMVHLKNEAYVDRYFWAEKYDGRYGHVFFGHQPFMEGVAEFTHATGMDTGCVFGGKISAVLLEVAHGEMRILERYDVKALGQYAEKRRKAEK